MGVSGWWIFRVKANSKYFFPKIHGRLLSYFVLDLGLAAVGLDLFIHELKKQLLTWHLLSTTSICLAFKLYLLVSS
jgi:hypothetical protein